MSLSPRSEHIVILGAGYAGLPCALRLGYALRAKGPARVRVTLINRESRQELVCELYRSLRTGQTEALPVAKMLRKAGVAFIEGNVHQIRPGEKRLVLRGEKQQEIAYDHLIVASGTKAKLPQVEGLQDLAENNERVFPFRNNQQVQALRRTLRQMGWGEGSIHDRDRFVVVLGAGATGIEVAGENSANLRGKHRRDRVVLVDGRSSLLTDFSPMAQRVLKKELRRLKIETILGSPAVKAVEGELHIENGQVIPWDLLVLCSGKRPPTLLSAFGEARTERGLRVRANLEVHGHPDHYAIGDAADAGIAKRAQFAVQQGHFLAELLIDRLIKNESVRGRHFEPTDLGYLVSLGPYSGVGRVGPEGKGLLARWASPFVFGPPIDEMKRLVKLKYLTQLRLERWL